MASQKDDTRRHWIEIIQETSKQYDKTVILVSSGAIGISLSFINLLSPIVHPLFLSLSWTGFAGAILFNLFSHVTSIEGYKENINQLDNNKEPRLLWAQLTSLFNYLTLALFFLGILFLCIFGYTNINSKQEANMGENKNIKLNAMDVIPNPPTAKDNPNEKGMPVIVNKPQTPKPAEQKQGSK
ncbi:MAG: hypothetical protein WC695_11750 [Candidatus Omnitrophota bacterium]